MVLQINSVYSCVCSTTLKPSIRTKEPLNVVEIKRNIETKNICIFIENFTEYIKSQHLKAITDIKNYNKPR